MFYVKLIAKYKIDMASNIATLLITIIKEEWVK